MTSLDLAIFRISLADPLKVLALSEMRVTGKPLLLTIYGTTAKVNLQTNRGLILDE